MPGGRGWTMYMYFSRKRSDKQRKLLFFFTAHHRYCAVTPSYQGTQPIITSHALSQSSAGFKIWLMQCMKVLPQGTALIHHRLMLRPKYKVHILGTYQRGFYSELATLEKAYVIIVLHHVLCLGKSFHCPPVLGHKLLVTLL